MLIRAIGRIATAIDKKPAAYFVVGFAVAVGLSCGILYPSVMAGDEQKVLILYVRSLMQTYRTATPNLIAVLLQSLLNNARIFLMIALAGLTRFGIPLTVIAEVVKGFGLGMSFASITAAYGAGGFLASLVMVGPHCLIYLCGYIAAGATSLTHAYGRGNNRSLSAKKRYLHEILPCCYTVLIGILVESTLSPYVMKWISHLLG